ncbi:hypothetical protein LCGC14_1030590 [marine sediment metagenome]|uniref:Uncharacterized protein n=1 Tax=marine sediment metagenome TaxID=412755 RepID=A0A0F9MUP5_9ZZZZ
MSDERCERCGVCDELTGRAGRIEDSLYCDLCEAGPFCESCWTGHGCLLVDPKEMSKKDQTIADLIAKVACSCNCHNAAAREAMNMTEHANCGECCAAIANDAAEMDAGLAMNRMAEVEAQAAVLREALEAAWQYMDHTHRCIVASPVNVCSCGLYPKKVAVREALSTGLAKRGRLVADVVAAARAWGASPSEIEDENDEVAMLAADLSLTNALAALDAKESILTEVVGAYEPKVSEPPEATQRRMRGDAKEAGDGN